MNSSTVKHRRAILLRAFSIALFLCALSAMETSAQRFEYFYGDDFCSEAGRNGVRPVSTGGYIACGETFSTDDDCAESDAYVVRTDNHGAHVWEKSYHIGGNDSATDVIEYTDGTFIVIGVTDNDPDICWRSRDLFVLRLDPCGNVLQVRTFGTEETDEIGWDVIETRSGDPGHGTNPGDLVIAGYTTLAPPPGARDAWLIRIDQAFNPIWGIHYDVGVFGADDYFYGLTEALASDPSDPTTTTHDIIACGGTDEMETNGYDGLIMRVDGNTGKAPGAGCQGTGIIGPAGVLMIDEDEDFRQVQELVDSDSATNIVAVGRESSQNAGVPEVYLAQTECRPWILVADRSLGDMGADPDEGYYIRENTAQYVGLTTGNLIVTGYVTTDLVTGFGKKDLFLQEYTPGLVPVAPTTRVFGGNEDDWGWSVHSVPQNLPWTTAGYIACGFSESWLDTCDVFGVDPRDLYLIKTNAARSSNCNDKNYAAVDNIPKFVSRSISVAEEDLTEWCDPNVTWICHNWECRLCLTADGTIRMIPPCRDDCGVIPPDTTKDTVVIKDTNVAGKIALSNLDRAPYPNPVRGGRPFAVEYAVEKESEVTLTVSDVAGKEVYKFSGKLAPGMRLFPVSTRGWSSGNYFVQITEGDRKITAQVVVER